MIWRRTKTVRKVMKIAALTAAGAACLFSVCMFVAGRSILDYAECR